MMAKHHKVAGLLLALLGAYVTFYSLTKLDVGTAMKPGSGFFTMICGSGILILSLAWLIPGMLKKPDAASESFHFWEKGQWLKPLLGVGTIFLYALLMVPLGYIISTALFLALWQLVVERSDIKLVITFTVVATIAMYVLFEVLLRVPLPNGLLRF